MNSIATAAKPDRAGRLSADDWAQAALDLIAEQGVAAVAVEPLARRLGVTKGSFYWHFPSREALLKAALERWEQIELEEVFARIEAEQASRGSKIKEYKFDMKQVEAFRYRMEDALRAVTRSAIREARIKELKTEILNSDKLKVRSAV